MPAEAELDIFRRKPVRAVPGSDADDTLVPQADARIAGDHRLHAARARLLEMARDRPSAGDRRCSRAGRRRAEVRRARLLRECAT
jgi:hypothetical protein